MPMVASCTAWFFPSLLRLYRSALRGVSDARHPTYDEIIQGRNRIGLGTQADLAGAIAGIPMLQEEYAVERHLDVLPPTATARIVCHCPSAGGGTCAVADWCHPRS